LAKKQDKKVKEKKIEEADDRKLGDHLFLRPFGFPLAIPTTNVGVALGYMYSSWKLDEKIDMLVFKDDTFQAGGLSENMDFEIEFLNRFSLELIIGRCGRHGRG